MELAKGVRILARFYANLSEIILGNVESTSPYNPRTRVFLLIYIRRRKRKRRKRRRRRRGNGKI